MNPRDISRRTVIVGGVSILGAGSGVLRQIDGGEYPDNPPPEQPPGEGIGGEAEEIPEYPPEDPPEDPPEPEVELADLVQYRSSEYGYSILYPGSWSVDETDPASVFFESDPFVGAQLTSVFSLEEQMTPAEVGESTLEYFEQNNIQTEVLSQQAVTLPTGADAEIIDYTETFEGTTFRNKMTIAVVDMTAYGNMTLTYQEAYTDEFDAIATQIAGSLLPNMGSQAYESPAESRMIGSAIVNQEIISRLNRPNR